MVNQSLGVNSDFSPKKSPENPDTKKPQFPPEKEVSALLLVVRLCLFSGWLMKTLLIGGTSEIVTYRARLLWFDHTSSARPGGKSESSADSSDVPRYTQNQGSQISVIDSSFLNVFSIQLQLYYHLFNIFRLLKKYSIY